MFDTAGLRRACPEHLSVFFLSAASLTPSESASYAMNDDSSRPNRASAVNRKKRQATTNTRGRSTLANQTSKGTNPLEQFFVLTTGYEKFVLALRTSGEQGNRYLDRAVLVKTFSSLSSSFFE